MQFFSVRIIPTIAACFLFANTSVASETPPGFADLVEKLMPSVVNISTTQKVKPGQGLDMFEMPEGETLPPEFKEFMKRFGGGQGDKDTEREVYALGSGFIIDEDGYIATNNHVISDAEEITVILSDDTKLKAKIVGRDPKTDLALLKVNASHKLPAAILGDSDKSRVGDWVIAIGNPFGLGGTVTAGIISARARNLNAGPFDDFIQTDAAINRGNSGGPMFNMKGEVIGINTAIFSPNGGSIGIGFAMPVSMAKSVFAQLKATGHIDRGWIGIKIQDVSDEIAESVGLKKTYGALVMETAKNSPSDQAGIVPGDIITKFDGKEIKEMRNLPRMVADTAIGKTVALEVWHKGVFKTVSVKTSQIKDAGDEDIQENGEGDKHEKKPVGKEILGMSLTPLDTAKRQKYGLPQSVKGLIITRINPNSEAMKQGLQQGDVIIQAGDTPVTSVKDLTGAIEAARKAGHKYVLLRVQNAQEESAMFITLPV